jgi:hypothetical protein
MFFGVPSNRAKEERLAQETEWSMGAGDGLKALHSGTVNPTTLYDKSSLPAGGAPPLPDGDALVPGEPGILLSVSSDSVFENRYSRVSPRLLSLRAYTPLPRHRPRHRPRHQGRRNAGPLPRLALHAPLMTPRWY